MSISKELLSAVLKVNATGIESPANGYSMLGFQTDNKAFLHIINIHELAHMVKEWIVSQEHNVANVTCRTFCVVSRTSAIGTTHHLLLFPNQDTFTSLYSSYNIEDLGEWILKEIQK